MEKNEKKKLNFQAINHIDAERKMRYKSYTYNNSIVNSRWSLNARGMN